MKRQIVFIIASILVTYPLSAQVKYGLYPIGFYNLENLFDTTHDEGKTDEEFLPDGTYKWTTLKYTHKLHNMARVLGEMATDKAKSGCVAIGVSEVENAHVLTDLCAQEPLAKRGYKFCHIEGPDKRGVDCALLYNPRIFKPYKVFLQPYDLGDVLTRPTRGFLTVQGTLAKDSITIIVCHWPSRFASSPARVWAGKQVRHEKDSLLKAHPNMKILVMGDMNDDPMDESMAKGLGARRKIADVQEGDMYNPFWQMLLDGIGTLTYNGKWNLFDQIVMTPNAINKDSKDFSSLKFRNAERFMRDYMMQHEGKYKGSPKRTHGSGVWLDGYSDHLPVITYFVKQL